MSWTVGLVIAFAGEAVAAEILNVAGADVERALEPARLETSTMDVRSTQPSTPGHGVSSSVLIGARLI